MNRIISRANKRITLGGAAALLIATSFSGQLLGFFRTKLVNANFLATGPQSTDAYFAAFKIPDFFFYTLAAGALGVAFMPVLADHLERGDKKGVRELTNSLLNLLALIMLVVGVIIMIFAEPLIHYIVAPDLSPEQLHNASTIMRLIAFNPLLFTLTGILTSVQQTYGRFFFYAVGPLFYNTAIIISIFIFRDNIGLIGLGVGALAGAILQLLLVILGLGGLGFKYRPKIMWRSKDFKLILRQLPPRSLDQGIDSLNSIVETNFARRLGEGNLSYFENAYTLHVAPTLLIGTAISTAAFPRLTARLAQGRTDLFRKDFLMVLRAMIWITLPVVVVAYFSRAYLARLIFARDSREIALIFGYLTAAILFRTLYTIISRWFYAQKDTKAPLYVSIFAIILNIFLAYTLSRPSAYGVAGLALAQSIVAASEVVILLSVMAVRDRKLFDKDFLMGLVNIISVTGFSSFAAYVMISLLPLKLADRGLVTLGAKLGLITIVTLATHIFVSWVFGLAESRPVRIDF
jgi:putative peptidoglycan lipid II flippase